jgi:hypothetical protein
MNMMYIIGLVSILILFVWKKYTSHKKRRNQYIKYLQEQNQKLQAVIQEEPSPSQSMPDETNKFSSSNVDNPILNEKEIQIDIQNPAQMMGLPQELAFMINMQNQNQGQVNQNEANVEDITEDFIDIREAQEEEEDEDVEVVSDCEIPEFETERDPEKVPLDQLSPLTKETCELNGKCSIQPLIEENFADIPIELYDKPSISVSQNDDSGIKASNTDDNRKYLEKDEILEESLDALIQTKQMHCTAILKSGSNKGGMCGKSAKRDGLCKMHHSK